VEKEILEIPFKAALCFEKNKGLILPEKVPYIGMGASYNAALVLKYLGVKIYPELASEYFAYQQQIKQFDQAVLISQSGETTDVVRCADCFSRVVAIVNDADSPLAKHQNTQKVIDIWAGTEHFSSSKTYINTLLTLYLGHGIDAEKAVESITKRFDFFQELGNFLGKKVFKQLNRKTLTGLYILGSGPNIGTAHQAALVLAETTRLPFVGMSLAQFDNGMKEAAPRAIVISLAPSKGKLAERSRRVLDLIEESGAVVYELVEDELEEKFSPISLILPFYFMANYIARKMNISEPFVVGQKINRTEDNVPINSEDYNNYLDSLNF
jgi:glucosamine--fructose-6-phosphate aminotransferase (isomerizing)